MSVFTPLNLEEVRTWLRDFELGEIVELKGIAAGITNTNYFVITHNSRYVLTIFEKNTLDELPYFVDLMAHLAQHGILCPAPIFNKNGVALHLLKNKPALMVSCLKGKDIATPDLVQVGQVATTLANMHTAGQQFNQQGHNQRGQDWFVNTTEQVAPKMISADAQLLKAELAHQLKVDTSHLPRGVVHGDLFRDNVLFDDEQLGGFIDFYYACNDVLAYDVAIAVNEWCLHHNGSDLGNIDPEKLTHFLAQYQQVRPFSEAEKQMWPTLLRRAALRFWLSRLYDFYYPADGALTHTKDPNHFKNLLQQHIAASS